jgi:S-(hydroxymethyl)glutathione dehydrogenase / alcohol dehydrogenase
VRHLAGGIGVNYAFEAIGREETIREAWNAVCPGGTAVVIGLPPKGSTVTIDTWGFINEKTLKGCYLGSVRLDEDVPRLVDLYAAGELRLDELVSDRIALAQLPQAFDRLRAGDALRQLVVF